MKGRASSAEAQRTTAAPTRLSPPRRDLLSIVGDTHAMVRGTPAPAAGENTETARRARADRVVEAGLSAACTASVILWRPALPPLLDVLLVLGGAVLAIDLARRELRTPSSVVPLACVIT